MRGRTFWAIAAALVGATVLGGAMGYAIGLDRRPTPAAFAARPLPASSPSYPVIPVIVRPDDPYPALAPGLRVRMTRIGAPPFQVEVPVPRGWVRSDATAGEWRWYPDPAHTKNVYFVRVSQVGANHQPLEPAVRGRITALREAADADDFAVEAQDADRFVASYVTGGHRRLNFEGFVARDGIAYVRIAVIGREVDRAGLSDLFRRLMADTRV